MKKILSILISVVILTGCSMNISDMDNTPTKKVEAFFNDYQTLSEKVLSDLDLVVAQETNFTEDQKEEYREIMKKHYQNLDYKIKEETVNGDSATVEAEITVTDFYKTLNNESEDNKDFYDDEGEYDESAYNKYRLDKLKNAKERVKYTLYITLSKDEKGEWVIDDLSDNEEQKILGMYEH